MDDVAEDVQVDFDGSEDNKNSVYAFCCSQTAAGTLWSPLAAGGG